MSMSKKVKVDHFLTVPGDAGSRAGCNARRGSYHEQAHQRGHSPLHGRAGVAADYSIRETKETRR